MAKKLSLREKLAKKREDLANKGGNFKTFILPKPGVYRMRHVSVGEEKDWAMEVYWVYLNKELGMVVLPTTFGEKSAINKAYEELKTSKNENDRNFAKKLQPKRGYLSPAFRYKDEKGKEIDTENGVKLVVLKGDMYQNMLDMFLDPDWDDFTGYKEGYDIKHRRDGTGQFDTKYSSSACPKNGKPIPKEFRGPYDIEKMVRELIPSYKEEKRILETFLSIAPDDEDEAPKKKKKKKSDI